MAGSAVTYHQAWDFVVEIDNVQVGGFTDCSGLGTEIKSVSQNEGGQISVVDVSTSTVTFPDITLKRGGSDNTELYDWHRNIVKGNQDKRNLSIVQQRGGVPVKRYNVTQAVIVKYMPGDWARSEEEKNITEEITLKHTGWTAEAV